VNMFITKPCGKMEQHVSHAMCSMHRQFFTILCTTWMIWQGEGGTFLLTVVVEVVRRIVVPCKMEKTMGEGGQRGCKMEKTRRKGTHGLFTGD
jgi:hypothetical protein